MSKEFKKLMLSHEESDRDYVNDIDQIKARIRDEFTNADEFIAYLEKDKKAAKAHFNYSATKPAKLDVLPVRHSDDLYVKKHTFTQRPYYHSHTFYEIIFVSDGKGAYYSYPQGEKIILEKGSVCLCAPGSVHALARAGKKDIILKAVVPANIFEEISDKEKILSYGQIRIFDNAGDKAAAYFHNFARENSSSSPLSRIAEKNWLSLFLVELLRGKREKSGDIMQKFNVYIEDNLKGASLAGFAKFAGYNPDYSSRVLKRETGRTFKENVADIRLKKAKELLTTTDMSVESVAVETGYQNASGFYKQFTSSAGITPAQYRRSQI